MLGGDLSLTAQRLRDAGLPAPSADDVRLKADSFDDARIEGDQWGEIYVGAKEVQGLRPGDHGAPVRQAAPAVFRAAEDAGLTVDNGEVMLGGWRGGTEKSLELHVNGRVDQMEYAAAVAGKAHNQSAVLVIDGPGDKAVTKVYLPYTPQTRELVSALQEHAPDGFTVRHTGPQTTERGVLLGRESGEIAGEPYQIEIVHLGRPLEDIAADLDLLFERLEAHGVIPGEHSVSNRTAFLVEAKDYDRVISSYSGSRSSGVRGRGEDVTRGAPDPRDALSVEGQGIGGAGGTRANRGAAGPLTPDRAEGLLLKVAKETTPEQYAREMGRAWLTASGRLVRVGGIYHDTLLNRAGISWRDTARAKLVRLNNENVEVSFEAGTSPGVSEAQRDTLAAIREASGRRLNVEATEIGPGPATTAPFDMREGGFAPRQIAGGSGASDRALTRADLGRIARRTASPSPTLPFSTPRP